MKREGHWSNPRKTPPASGVCSERAAGVLSVRSLSRRVNGRVAYCLASHCEPIT